MSSGSLIEAISEQKVKVCLTFELKQAKVELGIMIAFASTEASPIRQRRRPAGFN